MQRILFYTTCAGMLIAAACKKNDWGKNVATTLTPAVVSAPGNNITIDLDPMSNAIVTFEWEPSKAANHTLPFYKVLFAKAGGDFSTPVYTGVPGSLGTANKFSITHRELNKVANNAGIGALEKGSVQWTVVYSNGVVYDTADGRLLQLQRPAGFANNPADAYLVGSATEAGADTSKAMKFKKLSDGVFELYTSLNAGTYSIIDKSGVSFVLDGTLIKEGLEGNSPATTKKVYRIHLDFNTAVAKLTEIQEAGLWFAGYNRITHVLSYDGNGVFKASDIAITFSQQSWGKDERYKFRIAEKDANGSITNIYWGSNNKDNSKPNGSTAASYFLLKSNDASQWDYTWKFEKESAKADVLLKFQGTDYTHQVIFK